MHTMASIRLQLVYPSFHSAEKSNPKFHRTSISSTRNTLDHHRLRASSSSLIRPLKTDSHKASSHNIDTWMEDSIPDIVRNLKQAPLLVQIYSDTNTSRGDKRLRVQAEKALSERWPVMRDQWRNESPDGLIFVDELGCEGDGYGETRVWGLVVQSNMKGKGVECGPGIACYLLKTSRVSGGKDLGFCTHFRLMSVRNFWDSALEQLEDSWLVQ